MSEDGDILSEFLLESRESLDRLDAELVALEGDPSNKERLQSVFRTMHTIKGTAGFLGFAKLEAITHAAESLLSLLRNGDIALEGTRTTAMLAAVDATRGLLNEIEASGGEGSRHFGALIEAITLAASNATLTEAAGLLADMRGPSAKAAQVVSERPSRRAPVSVSTPDPPPSVSKIGPPPPLPKASRPPEVRVKGPEQMNAISVVPPRVKSIVPVAKPKAPAHVPPARPPEAVEERHGDTRIRVDVGLLDRLMNLVGELVLARNQLLQHAAKSESTSLVATSQRLNLITTELQEGVMKTRMQPIDHLWSRYPRIVRDLALACGKQVRLDTDGEGTELDKSIIEAIGDPLAHLVRNAVDHGIETPEEREAAGKSPVGTLRMRAFHEGGRVNIEISDDGAGIDVERVKQKALDRGLISAERARAMAPHDAYNLLFMPGFSTAKTVTNISGRGVGLDVVRTNVERIGGTVDIDSRLSRGTTFRIRIPLTLAIIPALVVSARGERFAIPQVNLIELVRVEAEKARTAIERIHGVPVFRLRGNLLALVDLGELLELDTDDTARDVNLVVLQADDLQFGLLVDTIHDTEEIVVKPLGRELKGLDVYAGATIMGDGRVALILDVTGLAARAGVAVSERRISSSAAQDGAHADHGPAEKLLIFRAGGDAPMALPLAAVARLEEFPRTRVEHMGETDAIQYRGEILPLVYLSEMFGGRRAEGDLLQVVVHTFQGRSVGFVVDAIDDIVEQQPTAMRRSGRRGMLGAAVIQGRVTELLDVESARSMMEV
ncbi:MAG: chemotaxis protein CheW [Polyangiaceae bacterium]